MEERIVRLEREMERVKKLLNGNGQIGLIGRIEVVWRSYIALLCALSALGGAVVMDLVRRWG